MWRSCRKKPAVTGEVAGQSLQEACSGAAFYCPSATGRAPA